MQDLEYVLGSLQAEFARMAGKNLLITGGAGFLGYYLAQSIVHWNLNSDAAKRIRLTIFDNYMRGLPAWLIELQKADRLVVIKHDIIQPLPVDIGNFEYIVHAASIASPNYYRAHPIETMDANVNGLRRLLDYCCRQKERGHAVEGFLFFSSSEIYGDPDPANIPTPESFRGNVSCTGPRACYDEAKRYGETLCVFFAQEFDLPIKVVRPFNNYGPGLKITDGRVIPDFAKNVLAGEDIVLFSDGSPTRTYCYIADAVCGYYKVLVNGRQGEAYNVGIETPEISVAQLADRIASIARNTLGYPGKVIRRTSTVEGYLIDNPNRRCPVIAKARADVGYAPSITLEHGLENSLVWYSGNRVAMEA